MTDYKINVVVDPATATKGAKEVEKGLKSAETAAGGLEKAMHRAVEAYLGFEGAKHLLEVAEAAEAMDAKLRLVTSSEEDLIETTERLREISNAGGVSLNVTAEAYQRLVLASRELGKSSEQVQTFLKNLEITARASGGSVAESAAAIKALSYAMSTGEVSGRALRTIFNDLPTVADAIAEHMGVTRSGLKELGDQGKISAEDLFAALDHVSTKTQELANRANALGASENELSNNFQLFVKQANESIGFTDNLALSFKVLADALHGSKEELDGLLQSFSEYQKTQERVESDNKHSSIGSVITNLNQELRQLESRKVITADTLARIDLLKLKLAELQGTARAVTHGLPAGAVAPGAAAGAAPGRETVSPAQSAHAAAAAQEVEVKRLLNAEDVRRASFIENVTLKIEQQTEANEAQLAGDRDALDLSRLISAQQDKDLKKKIELTEEEKKGLLAKVATANAIKDQAAAYQALIGPQQEYERGTAALLELEKQHPELHAQIEQSLDKLRIRYLDTSTDISAGFERAFLKIKEEANDFASVAESAVNVFADDATKALDDVVTEGKGSFDDFRDAVLKDLEKILIRFLVVQAITGIVGGPAAAAIGGTAGGAIAGQHANGGTEQPGHAYIVGENGPEVHTPGRTGSTAPIGGGKSQVNLQIVNVKDPNEVAAVIASGAVDDQIINRISVNRDKVRQVVR